MEQNADEQKTSIIGLFGGCTSCFAFDPDTTVSMREVPYKTQRAQRESNIIYQAQHHHAQLQHGSDEPAASEPSSARAGEGGGATARAAVNTPKGQNQLLRHAAMDMVKVRQKELARCEATWRKLEAELAEDTKRLRSVLPSLEGKPLVKEGMLLELKEKVSMIKTNKSKIQDLEREITDLNITKRMGVAPFTTSQKTEGSGARSPRSAAPATGRRASGF